MKPYLTCLSLFVLLAGLSPALFAQPPDPGGGGFKGVRQADGSRIIKKLNWALEAAGAPLLTTGEEGQEGQIAALLDNMRADRPVPDPENRGSGPMKDYAAAILNGDMVTINRIASELADAMAARTSQRLVARAEFQINLLNILDPDQIQSLTDQFGEHGLLRLLNSHGRRGGQFGPGGRRGGGGGGLEGFRERMRVAPRGEVTGP